MSPRHQSDAKQPHTHNNLLRIRAHHTAFTPSITAVQQVQSLIDSGDRESGADAIKQLTSQNVGANNANFKANKTSHSTTVAAAPTDNNEDHADDSPDSVDDEDGEQYVVTATSTTTRVFTVHLMKLKSSVPQSQYVRPFHLKVSAPVILNAEARWSDLERKAYKNLKNKIKEMDKNCRDKLRPYATCSVLTPSNCRILVGKIGTKKKTPDVWEPGVLKDSTVHVLHNHCQDIIVIMASHTDYIQPFPLHNLSPAHIDHNVARSDPFNNLSPVQSDQNVARPEASTDIHNTGDTAMFLDFGAPSTTHDDDRPRFDEE
jgi:hypothetical protein